MASNNLQSNEDVCSPFTPNSPQHSFNFHLSEYSASNSHVRSKKLQRASDLLMAVSVCTEVNRTRIRKLADAAMEELTRVALDGDPLWKLQEDEEAETYYTLMDIMKMVEVGEPHLGLLDLEIGNTNKPNSSYQYKYKTTFGNYKDNIQQDQHQLKTEISRQTGYVRMDALRIVGLLMDLKQWSLVFSNIVSRAAILEVLSSMGSGDQNYHGTLQVMTAEFFIPTPLVPTRESYFARYCKQLDTGTWGVVDVSLEDLFPYPSIRFRRKPSGCLIQANPNGPSKVVWVEHVEVDNRWVPKIFHPFINSRLAFGAKRWLSALLRHSNRLITLMAKSSPTVDGVLLSQAGRTSLLKLSERMMRSFYVNTSASKENLWMQIPISGAEDMRVMTKKSNHDPGKPPCTSVVFATSLQIPATPNRVFDFLRHEKSRNKWDILSYGHAIQELACIINGDDSRNRVSIIQVNSAPRRIEIFYLQESFFDASGSYVVYAPVDIFAMSMILNGGNPDNLAILASGFTVFPDRPRMHEEEDETDGSILTIALNIIDHSISECIPFESMDSMHKIVAETVASIKEGIKSNNGF